ncbi:MAG: CHAD domain-containing protein [Gemmatimonadota bacterium]|nr:CHAD domain-containing protein [Gemmatimonadota bacterium]
MSTELPADALDRPAPEMARWLALSLLDDAIVARKRLDDPDDAEALHDFRVAIRRLRSSLRAYREQLEGSVSTKTRRMLGKLASATGASRDDEVHLAWLDEQAAHGTARQRHGFNWLRDHLKARKEEDDGELRREVRRDFERVRRRLDRRLRHYRVEMQLGESRPASSGREVTGHILIALARELDDALKRVHSIEDEAEAHRARIAGKRLRYALEPLRVDPELNRLIVPLLELLKTLQDQLGDVHDASVFSETIIAASADAASDHARELSESVHKGAENDRKTVQRHQRRDPQAGLLELVRRLRDRGAAAYASVANDWLDSVAPDVLRSVRELGERLVSSARSGLEIERKYLLRELPEMPAAHDVLDITQGYLPGERIHERLRHVSGTGDERWYRTMKSGSGLTRVEHEEETTPEMFTAMWPLTAGKRIRKRRHEVRVGDSVWQIDEFLDHRLVLAEIELPSADAVVEPPEWLAPLIEREVTGEQGYDNAALAD